jgi:DNA-binding Xre family transcriptional regulator
MKSNLAVLLAERGLRMIDVVTEAGLNKNTVSSLYYNRSTGIQYDTLEKICNYLQIEPSDLFTLKTNNIIENNKNFCPYCGKRQYVENKKEL